LTPTPTPTPDSDDPFPLAAEATRGITNPELSKLMRDHWDSEMAASPIWATTRGDHRFDAELVDNSDAAVAVRLAGDRALLERANAIDMSALDSSEKTTLALLIGSLQNSVAIGVCEGHLWQVSPFDNPISNIGSLPTQHKVRSESDADNLLARYKAIPAYTDRAIANLKLGAERGLLSNAESVKRAIVQIDEVLGKSSDKWALLAPVKDTETLASLSETKKTEWLRDMWTVVDGPVRDSYKRYREFLVTDILPKARAPKDAGLGGLSIGPACYQARIKRYLSLDRTAEELHALGLSEIKRINDEMRALGKKLFDEDKLGAITTRLRTDSTLYYKSAGEIMTDARAALAAARAKAPAYFGIQPKADCVVTPIPEYEAKFSTIAYYREPHADGSVPGKFFINTYKPSVRPRFEMRVLAYHEAIPGHHLQIAISLERDNLPAFRRSFGSTAYVEGWALYTERLSDEMGLYETDLDRMGMLSYDAWRASRLVVDTGIHSKGWTREQAEEFMREHTALTGANITNEVDRYINWPGQALAYKVGQLEILSMREAARAKLGTKFDIKAFHDVVLREGAVTLPVLKRNVEAWVAEAGR